MIKKLFKPSSLSRKKSIKTDSKNIKNIFLFFIASILFFSCEKNVEEDSELFIDTTCEPDISYVTNIKPIIDNNCLACHAGSQPPNLSFYEGVSNNANLVKTQVVSRAMPREGSLTEEEIQLISCWVDNGALNN